MKVFTVESLLGNYEMVEIETAEGQFTQMLKSTYDAMQAEQSTPMVTDATPSL
jgi:hypothetical protein